jgi:hypothetical protein
VGVPCSGSDWGGFTAVADGTFYHFGGFLLCAVFAQIRGLAGYPSALWPSYCGVAGEGGDQSSREEGGDFNIHCEHISERSFFALALGVGACGGDGDQRDLDLDAARGLMGAHAPSENLEYPELRPVSKH